MKRYEFDWKKYCMNKNTELRALYRDRQIGICTIDAFCWENKINGNLGRNSKKKYIKDKKSIDSSLKSVLKREEKIKQGKKYWTAELNIKLHHIGR